ncbi:hypothetical protein PLICRDRAFT_50137 [Plicaturopsis crispa FD-325 SS-3]|nr:hypothetical protein PLICRDRAFT_50137 [Plicaturopsis crispa FD-325 SS-3]
MVSTLWKACSEGNLELVNDVLQEASTVDIEIKDHTGVTPLIEAVRNGHVEIVRALLDKGADPTSSSSQGRPEQYTSDPAILELLHYAQSRLSSGMPMQDPGYPQDPSKQYYAPPPGPYAYYPGIPQGPPLPDGAVAYYPIPPPPSGEQPPGGVGNLPPPDVARFIPCRYFPACRYGASCMFAHPQAPYYPGAPPPPAQYPAPYDPNMAQQPYSPNYYAPSFQPANGVPQYMGPMSPQSGPHPTPPQHAIAHTRVGSEIISPVQGHFSPNGAPPIPYGAISPITPNYPQPGPIPVPLSLAPLPPLHQQQPPQGPQSPQAMYHNATQQQGASPFVVRQDAVPHYQPVPQGSYPDGSAAPGPKSPSLHPQPDGYTGTGYRDVMNHNRRGSVRRGGYGGGGGGRKPPCMFFPSGRCRNGDECRFPHVIPEGPGPHHQAPFASRGPPRPRAPPNGNGYATIEEKLSTMAIKDDAPPSQQNGIEGSSRSQSTDAGSNARYPQGPKSHAVNGHGPRPDSKRAPPPSKQRVPNADEFPTLAGFATPPLRSPGWNASNGNAGPTAAQVLQAPPPARRDSAKGSTRNGTPEPAPENKDNTPAPPAVNGSSPDVPSDSGPKIPLSFASIANGTHDIGNQVSVSA